MCRIPIINSGRHDRGCLWIFGGKISSRKKIFICRKQYRCVLSCDVVYFFIAFVPIELSLYLYLSVVRMSMEATDPTNEDLRVRCTFPVRYTETPHI